MNYFKYQKSGSTGRVWSLFSELGELSEEEILGKGKGNLQYAHTLEIVRAGLNNALKTDDESLQRFNLSAYEYTCAQNDKNNKRKAVEKLLYIVDNFGEEDSSVGFGDVSERKLKSIEDSFELIESITSFESNIAELCNIRKEYISVRGIDLVNLIKNSLKGIPEAVKELKSVIKDDSPLKELIANLCEEGADGVLLERLEAI
jgi:hypothetical protein